MTERNCTIDIFRYVCAIMVVAIHTAPFADINENLGYIFTEVVPRIAVPFFFITSGFFYCRSLEKGTTKSKVYLFRLLKVYALWGIVYYAIDFIKWGYMNLKGFITHCVYTFVITGSHYHFWFFPALIISACFVTLLYKLKLNKAIVPIGIILYIIGCLGCSYRGIGVHIPGLSALYEMESFTIIRRILLMGIPFFSAGMIVDKVRALISKYVNKKKVYAILLSVAIILWLVEILLVNFFNLSDNIVITLGLYPLVAVTIAMLIEYPCPQYAKLAGLCHNLADFTYYVHPLVILFLQMLASAVSISLDHTPLFILTVVLSACVGRAVYMCRSKLIGRKQ